MPNPNGTNSFDRFAPDSVHGTVQRDEALRRAAPMSGAPLAGSAMNSPARAQRRAVRGEAPGAAMAGAAPAAPAVSPMPAPEGDGPELDMADRERVAAIWAEIASRPGASQLVKQIAAEAATEAGLVG